ncbi:hypothetical protein [Achromobacter denitrificans]|uniref:Uncharacterized protein n=1 Tax=Achromobacter denitrificans TaxID=32002 RepID=A0A6N0JN76_ACHDE|nr:hypothetical protein [Achromobacter denitrificans]QKQ48504.1 hypothetical protein FOC81_18110 [Achromobacter denitrificans]
MSERNAPFARLAVALAYAFSNERHTSNRPAMARAADEVLGEPGQLAGMDGAAEIGNARRFLERGLSQLDFAVLFAKYGQRKTCCKACGGASDHPEWMGALHRISVALAGVLSMPSVHSEMRFALVRRYYEGNAPTIDFLANQHECRLRSAERAAAKTADWLRGTRGVNGTEAVRGLEQLAHAEAERLLRDGGFIP